MTDLARRFGNVESIVCDKSLPKWRRATEALQALSGLELSALPVDVSSRLETNLVGVNQVMARYDLKAVEDYEQISDQDLQEILDKLGTLASTIHQAD